MKIQLKIAILFSLLTTSCNYLDVDPEYVMAPETFYQSQEDVVYGLTGIYGVINSEELYGNYYTLMLSNPDDLCYQNRAQSGNHPHWYTHTTSDTYVYKTWSKLYEGVKNANEFMEAILESELDEDGAYYAEARFLRAYYHFLLAQAWGDVPLRTSAVTSAEDVEIAATSQREVLEWCASEMAAVEENFAKDDLTVAPYRITRSAVQGILVRVYLFLAGESVEGVTDREQMWSNAALYAGKVISANIHRLNPDFDQVFINMISDVYDTTYYESIWEADFMGNHSSGAWSNGRIGDLLGLQSSGSDNNYSEWSCNYSYAQYNGSLKLWDLYFSDGAESTDARQEWSLPPYNYNGYSSLGLAASYDKSPYGYGSNNTFQEGFENIAGGKRNAGKFRREVIYEGQMTAKDLYTSINFPILRYSDVLLMYAEACNELGALSSGYDALKQVRDRAGVETYEIGYYDQSSFRELVRNERGRELAFEALRKYDLIRWGIFVEQMNHYPVWASDDRWSSDATAARAAAIGDNVAAKHLYLPIPTLELGVNRLLKQNSLW